MRFSRYEEVSSLIPSVPRFLHFEVPVLSRSFRTLKTIHERASRPARRPIRYCSSCSSQPLRLRRSVAPSFLSASAFASADRPGMSRRSVSISACLPRKEVIQPHLPIRLPCYDFTPVIWLTFGSWLLAVTSLTSGAPNSLGVTGGVYKARERIHRGMLIRDY